ncbi:hypothetical protein KL929_004691 [Ogataea haglerorum]|nr:hypothetical protein KL929_004691 [Ogataea haglerorum]
MTISQNSLDSSPTLSSQLESNRAKEMEELIIPTVQLIIQQIKDTDEGKRSLGARYEDPRMLYSILNLDKLSLEKGLREDGKGTEKLLATVKSILDNSVNTWHPGFLDKLYASTNPIGVLSDIVLSVLNTNSHVFTVSPALTVIERTVAQKYAALFGFTGKNAGGLTFSGGSWSNITSLHMARSLLFPETKVKGNTHKFAIYTSVHSHYSVEKAAILLGLGANSVFKIPVDKKGRMLVSELEKTIQETKNKGYTPLYVNATAGTTVFGSFDPFEDIAPVAKNYGLWFHIDGSWGGNAIFSTNKAGLLAGSHLADSITSNPHKMLGVPTTCSFLLVPNDRVFTQANSLSAPYLFHNAQDDNENFDLANGTMGCGRRADALKFYLGWLYYGTNGYRERVDHAYAIAEYFTERASQTPGFSVVSDTPLQCLQVCFYYNPENQKLTGAERTHVTRHIATRLHGSGQFLVDYAPNPDDAANNEDNGEFFRVVFNSPIVSSDVVDQLIDKIVEVGKTVPKLD